MPTLLVTPIKAKPYELTGDQPIDVHQQVAKIMRTALAALKDKDRTEQREYLEARLDSGSISDALLYWQLAGFDTNPGPAFGPLQLETTTAPSEKIDGKAADPE